MRGRQKNFFLIVLIFFLFLVFPHLCRAGFGITPPYFKNESLTRSSIFQQKIVLVRGNPSEDLKVRVIIDVPKANEWISIDKGNEFVLPKGVSQFPILITVKVPEKAPFGTYKGRIVLKTSPLKGPRAGTVGIVLGAQIDVDLKVIDKKIFDFKVLGIRLFDLEEGHKFLWMYIPGKIVFSIRIKNLGNVRAKPTRVHLDIFDSSGKKLLESLEARKIKGEVKPFQTKEVIAEFATKLKSGSYWVNFAIFKNEEIVKKGHLHLSILPYGSIEGYKGYGLAGLSLVDKVSLILVILLILGGAGFVIFYTFKKKKFLIKK